MARQHGRGKCVPLLPLLPEHISPGSQLEAGHRPGRSCSWFQPPRPPSSTVDTTTLHEWVRSVPAFRPHRTRRAWTDGKLSPLSPVREPTAAAKWRARGVGGSEGDAEDPPEHAEEPDEVAHLQRSDSDPGEGSGQDSGGIRDSHAGIRELYLEIKREREIR